MSDRDLMNLYAEFVAWQNYFSTRLARCEGIELERATKVRRAEAFAAAASEQKSVTIKKAEAQQDEDVIRANDRLVAVKADKKALALYMDSLDRAANLLSRELTRRLAYVNRPDRVP
jgi:hypothetical protein